MSLIAYALAAFTIAFVYGLAVAGVAALAGANGKNPGE